MFHWLLHTRIQNTSFIKKFILDVWQDSEQAFLLGLLTKIHKITIKFSIDSILHGLFHKYSITHEKQIVGTSLLILAVKLVFPHLDIQS